MAWLFKHFPFVKRNKIKTIMKNLPKKSAISLNSILRTFRVCNFAAAGRLVPLEDQVLVEGRGHSRTLILNRPDALNSLTTSLGARLQKLYESWENNPDVGLVMMKGSGYAFCPGGDIIGLYHMINDVVWSFTWTTSFAPYDAAEEMPSPNLSPKSKGRQYEVIQDGLPIDPRHHLETEYVVILPQNALEGCLSGLPFQGHKDEG